MSVALIPGENLPGTVGRLSMEAGKRSLWTFESGVRLRYVADTVLVPTHGVIEPTIPMPFAAYQQALAETAPYWARQ
jgi:hypothetical protein